jgi:DNA-binding response OmpR family regulator
MVVIDGFVDGLPEMFKKWQVKAIYFISGEAALEWIDDVEQGLYAGELPELAIIGLRLPGRIQGVDVSARIRQSPALNGMAVVLSTAYLIKDKEAEKSVMQRAGADFMLVQPWPKAHEFRRLMDDVLARR